MPIAEFVPAAMKVMSYLVAGESVAGVASALTLADAGRPVQILLLHGDSAGLEDTYLIGPTPLNASPMRGEAFAGLALEALERRGVRTQSDFWFGVWDEAGVDPLTGELILDFSHDRDPHRFHGAVFAPSGSEVGLSYPNQERFFDRGLSCSAWSDAPYFRGRRVAVAGCGARAYDQALILAEFAAEVSVLCERESVEQPSLLVPAVAGCERLRVLTGVQDLSLVPGSEGRLAAVAFAWRGERQSLAIEGLFAAHDPVVTWDSWGGHEAALALQRRGKLALAGIAAGVDYADHAALYASGVRAARELLAVTPADL